MTNDPEREVTYADPTGVVTIADDWPNGQLEALHSCHIVEGVFEAHVLAASFVCEDPDLSAQAEKVHEAIVEMYQAIGRKKADTP